MKAPPNTARRIAVIVLLTGCVLVGQLCAQYFLDSRVPAAIEPPFKNIVTVITKEHVSSGIPVRIEIPRINLDTIVIQVGLTPNGAMAVPSGPTETAWYKLGPHPGEIGSAVISGHYGWKDNISAAFDSLHRLEIGDTVRVEDENGRMNTFIVRAVRSYYPQADASLIFSSGDIVPHLNLITCEGTWNQNQKSYSKRLVVFTNLVM